jgi:hypothetical protein
MSPALSWALFLVCVAIGAAVYVVVAGGRRYRRILSDADTLAQLGRDVEAMRYDPLLFIRVLPHVYDWSVADDFGDRDR